MAEFNIDEILNKFGSETKSKENTFDIDSILSKFGSKKEDDRNPSDVTIKIRPSLGEKGYQVDPEEFNKPSSGEPNPRDKLPTTSIADDIKKDYKSGKETLSSGLDDIAASRSATGVGKVALGALQAITAPVTGLIEGGISKPIADITGSKDIGDKAGIVAGSAVPVGGIGNKIVKSIPKNKMLSRLVEHIGPENLPEVVSAMKANPRLAPADLSPKVLQSTQELFANGGQPVNYLANTSAARLAGAKGAATGAFDASMGATVNAAQKIEDLKNAAREIGKKNIEPVLVAKPHTDVTDLIRTIDKEIGYPAMKAIKEGKSPPLPLTTYQRELLDVRNKLRNPAWPEVDKAGKPKPLFAYTDQVHDAQIALREAGQAYAKSPTAESHVGGKLLAFREKMKDAVGPEYKEALSKYAGQKKVEEAFHKGYDTILSNSPKLENDPSFFEKWINSSSRKPGELEAAREGARLRIEAAINGNRTAATNPSSKAVAIGQNDFSVQRLEALLGKSEADKLLKTLEDERKIANTHGKIIEGSQTAMRSDTKSEWKRPEKPELNNMVPYAAEAIGAYTTGIPAVGALTYQGLKGVNSVVHKVKMAIARENEARYAKYALPTEGPSRDELIRQLEARIPGPKQSLVTRAAGSLSKLVAP